MSSGTGLEQTWKPINVKISSGLKPKNVKMSSGLKPKKLVLIQALHNDPNLPCFEGTFKKLEFQST